MSRARATALVLVNWRGVFYERYELDPAVTALEGANGAGKTTVMIAAYLVLLPDMTRLRFTNLGETGATGGDKGIWGRLGRPGRPAWASIEFRVGGGRLLAGVHLDRKAEPTVELTPFLVTSLPEDVRLQDLLLLRHEGTEQVPELPELKEQVARAGARLQTFDSARDYFAALFDHGVTPLRLQTDEERNKLNEMLRTSMTGGISRALTSELRGFLLREQSGLADTLTSMRANLDACRRTRNEVQDAQRTEREVAGVYEVGEHMFAAAVHATRERAREHEARVERARAADLACRNQLRELDEELRAHRERQTELEALVARTKQARDEAAAWLDRVRRACAIAQRLSVLEEEAIGLRRIARERTEQLERVTAERDQARAALKRAEEARKLAADGLADLQRGLEELHRRADAHRRAVACLAEARRTLDRPELGPPEVDDALRTAREEQARLDAERARLDSEIELATRRREEHGRATAALARITRASVGPDAYTRARDLLAELDRLEILVERLPTLTKERDDARLLAVRQIDASQRAERLELPDGPNGPERVQSAIDAEDAAITALRGAASKEREAAEEAGRTLETARQQIAALEARGLRWREAVGRAQRLEEAGEGSVVDRSDLRRIRVALEGRRDTAKAEVSSLDTAIGARIDEARELERDGGTFHPDLLRLRDELAGELLASRFEDVDLDEAGPLQAVLGPLADALLVDDPVQAAAVVAGKRRDLSSVWLVSAEHPLDIDAIDSARGGDVLVPEVAGVRVTRVPERPSLGRRARAQRVAALRTEAEALTVQREAAHTTLVRIGGWLRVLDELLPEIEVLEAGDPSSELASARDRAGAASAAQRAHIEKADALDRQIAPHAQRRGALQRLLPDASLLDPPDHAVRAAALEAEHARATEGRAELVRVRDDRQVLSRSIDALRSPPPTEEAVGEMRARQLELGSRRVVLFGAIEALEYVSGNSEALAWTDAEPALSARTALVPELEAQHARAVAQVGERETARDEAEARWDEAREAAHEADGRLGAVEAEVRRATNELTDFGVDDPSPDAVAAAEQAVSRSEEALTAADRDQRSAAEARVRCEERQRNASDAAGEAAQLLAREERDAVPHARRWRELEATAEAHDVLGTALTARFVDLFGGRGNLNIWSDARTKEGVLLHHLASASGGAAVAAEIRGWLANQEEATGETYLRAWLAVLDWLRRRLPAFVVEVDDPLVALERLRGHLVTLEDRLARQEDSLRGASEDVARGIDVQIRRARTQVGRLNRNLEGVRFGSIRGIRVKMALVERMAQVLRALREGEAQELLFGTSMPIEEALEAIFARYGGGRTGGQRLLDYREYVALSVEVKRQVGDTWETANPTRLSTGEAIGVGAALMMVILTEWERDANLLRGRRAAGSLRFLFLDEANRLSHDNLGQLFELCEALELQLLIAAPEVARAEGNTTYRLVRLVGDDGHEEVLVSGRRTRVHV